jgi:hypothetical protein
LCWFHFHSEPDSGFASHSTLQRVRAAGFAGIVEDSSILGVLSEISPKPAENTEKQAMVPRQPGGGFTAFGQA